MKKLFIAFAGCLFTCLSAFSQSSESYNLQYTFQQGDHFQMQENVKQDSYLDVQGVSQRTSQQMDNILLFTVTKINPDKSALITAEYKKISVNASADNQQMYINTDSDSSDVFNKLFKQLIAHSFTLTMQPNGAAANISGLDKILEDAIKSIPEKRSADEKAALENLITNLFGTDAMQNKLLQVLPYYPDHAVNNDDNWTDNYHLNGALGGNMLTIWKMEYADKYNSKISSQGKMTSDKTALVSLGGNIKGNVDIAGNISGNYLINMKTGWPSLCIQHTEITGKYIYKAGYDKRIKQDIEVPVRMVSDARYKVLHL